jgi:hypothetical protein
MTAVSLIKTRLFSRRGFLAATTTLTVSLAACAAPGAQHSASTEYGQPEAAEFAPAQIKIAVMAPITGAAAAVGEPQLNFARMAVEDFNREHGMNIELVEGDTELDPARASTLAQRLIEDEAVLAEIVATRQNSSLLGIPIAFDAQGDIENASFFVYQVQNGAFAPTGGDTPMDLFLTQLPQQIANGLSLGAVYALVALGYALVYGVLRLLNFAHGDVFMVGAFVGYALHLPLAQEAGLPGWLALLLMLPATMLTCGLLGMLIERLAYRPR